tara:strand:- start:3046 stop:3336 length:291 start_codon:yes stop_codon:yes gene_type:complete
MKYSNVVRWKAKEGEFDNLITSFKNQIDYDGLLQNFVIKTGNNTGCSVGVWESETHITNARPKMIEFLDSIRDKLEVLSNDLGVTDPISGPIIIEN